jgi:hypothetical protein
MAPRPGQAPIRRSAQVLKSTAGRRILAANSLVAFGAISAGIQFLAALYRSFPPYPGVTFALSVAICVAWGFARSYPRFSLRHRMTGKNIVLSVIIGDLFDQETHIAVGFSDTFDTSVTGNRIIHSSSVQGQLLLRVYRNDRRRLDKELSAALRPVRPVKGESRADKAGGKLRRYPVGTVAVLGEPQRRIFAVAYGRMGNDLIVRSPVDELWYCFSQLWEAVYRKGHQQPVSVPLMGTGLARINSLDHEGLLRVILLSFAAYSRVRVACRELRVVIRPEDVAHVNLVGLRDFLCTL